MAFEPSRFFLVLALVLGLVLALVLPASWTAPPATAAAQTPRTIVERLNTTLLEVMREAKALGYQGRYDRLAPVLTEAFNFPLMAGISAGRHWRNLDEGQRARLIDAFSRISIATFASRFDGFSGERFRILGEAPAPRKSILVRSQLVKTDGEAVELNYLLRTAEGRWRVVDVFLDAKYSELAMRRSEYSSVIKNHGFDDLIRSIEEKVAELAAEG